MTSLIKIEGIGAAYAEKLRVQGIRSLEALLQNGLTPKSRQDLSTRSGVSEKLILEWVNLADLFRIKGIGEEYSDLLEEAGVDTVPELAQRNPVNLYEAILALNQQKKLVRKLPTQAQVADWVAQAKALPRLITY
jgi:predicted flap endonuclease-1-like 5' DNA nuclease